MPAMMATAPALTTEILAIAETLRTACPSAVPVAFWDFDGTLIEGDCSEGLSREDGSGFPGLAEVAVARGFSKRFQGPHGRAAFAQETAGVLRAEGHAAANAFIAQAFAGARESDLLDLARRCFANVLGGWMFPGALALWHALEAAGVRCWVISASADFFVKGAAEILQTSQDRLQGIRLRVEVDGRLGPEVVPPLTYGYGKHARMVELLGAMAEREPGRSFWPVAALGNSPATDGPLLEAVAQTRLPAGAPLGVIINPAPDLKFSSFLKPAVFPGRPRALVA